MAPARGQFLNFESFTYLQQPDQREEKKKNGKSPGILEHHHRSKGERQVIVTQISFAKVAKL
jgi:hypothetical protein